MKNNKISLENGSTIAVIFNGLDFFRIPNEAETTKILDQLAVLVQKEMMLQKTKGNLLFEISESKGPDLVIILSFVKENGKLNPLENKKIFISGYVTIDTALGEFLGGSEVKSFIASCK